MLSFKRANQIALDPNHTGGDGALKRKEDFSGYIRESRCPLLVRSVLAEPIRLFSKRANQYALNASQSYR